MPTGDLQHVDEVLRAGWDCHRQGDFQSAELHYRQALAIAPNHPAALNSMATLAMQFNQPAPACELLQQAIASDPNNLTLHLNLGSALRAVGRFDEALASAQRAVQLGPDLPGPHTLLAAVLADLLRYDEALAAVERAIAIDPEFFQGLQVYQSVCGALIRPRDVITAADRLIRIEPHDPRPHWNKAIASLLLGDFETGWAEFEWRTRFDHLRRDFPKPPWSRQDLTGKTILLHCEGGFGDAIQFVRYVPRVKELAGLVLLECPTPLSELFRGMPGCPPLIERGQSIPPFDYHCPLQSLPFNFETRLESIPAKVPYLFADRTKSEAFARRIGDGALRVGLVWAGSAMQVDVRSRTLATYAPLFQIPSVRFFGLQSGPDAGQCVPPVHDLSPHLHDFADLAGAIANLDLVISVDTSVAHLAGAMGKDVWILIPMVCDFRWMLDRADSPWYPTMRLYRQTSRTDWNEPIARMARDLAARVKGNS